MGELEDDFQRRGAAGIVLLVVPIVSILLVGLGYAILLWYGLAGRAATGPVATVAFSGCDEALPLMQERVGAMGLPEAVWTDTEPGFSLTARFPEDPAQLEAIPTTLAARGRLEVRALDAQGNLVEDAPALASEQDIVEALPYMAFLDTPRVRIVLETEAADGLRDWMESHMDQGVAVFFEGRQVMTRRNIPSLPRGGELDLDLEGAPDRERLAFIASTAIVLGYGPLPCDMTVDGVILED